MSFIDYVLSSSSRLSMPIAVYPGLTFIGATVRQLVTDSKAQYEAVSALRRRYDSATVLTAMDLSVEAETFGATVAMSDDEVPTIEGKPLSSPEDIEALPIPEVNRGRGRIFLETVSMLDSMTDRPQFVIGGLIGPYTLAARLFGVSEALELTLLDAVAAHKLLEKTTGYLITYALAFKSAGADAICMAEPAAGLLWPDGLREFSSVYVRRIAEAVEDDTFKIILHNCGCKLEHLPAVLDSGVKCLHFGAPMDIVETLKQVPPDVMVCGNLDPSEIFVSASSVETYKKTLNLLSQTEAYRNFLLSSGCDLPPNTKLENLDAFYQALRDFTANNVE